MIGIGRKACVRYGPTNFGGSGGIRALITKARQGIVQFAYPINGKSSLINVPVLLIFAIVYLYF